MLKRHSERSHQLTVCFQASFLQILKLTKFMKETKKLEIFIIHIILKDVMMTFISN